MNNEAWITAQQRPKGDAMTNVTQQSVNGTASSGASGVTAPRLSVGEKIGYGLGDTASNLFFQTTIYFLSFFYTDVFGLETKVAGTMFLATRIWDAINDPLMGAIADRTKTRWGRYRPFLLWFAIPFGVIGVSMFTTPEMAYTGKVIYAYVTYTLMMMVYTAINVPYCALMGVISPNPQERTVVSSFRFVLVFIAALLVQYFLQDIVIAIGKGFMTAEQIAGYTAEELNWAAKRSVHGWQIAMGILFGTAVILFFVTFLTTRERVQPIKEERNAFRQDMRDLVKNGPWLIIGIATVFQLIFVVMRGSAIVYYFDNFIKTQSVGFLNKTFDSTQLSVAFMLIGTAFTIAGAILTRWFCKFMDKSVVYASLFIVAGIATGLVFFVKPEYLLLLFGLQIVTSFCMGPVSTLQWAIYTDTADYSEWKTGRRATALIMAASLFALKIGVAIGGAAFNWILAGYAYDHSNVTPLAVKGICLNMSVYAAIPAIIAGALMLFYPLTNRKMLTIEADLAERREQSRLGAEKDGSL